LTSSSCSRTTTHIDGDTDDELGDDAWKEAGRRVAEEFREAVRQRAALDRDRLLR